MRPKKPLVHTLVAIAGFVATLAEGRPLANNNRIVSKSIGSPNHGRLEGGVRLETGPHLRVVGVYDAGDVRWGTRELVDLIDRSAREVRRRFPDAVLGVGHLSRRSGGELDRHHSHESGRDADLAFYIVDAIGRPITREHFVAIGANGAAVAEPHVRFDDARNWALVSALVTDSQAHVTHIFVETHLRTRLLAYGARAGASSAIRTRIAEVLMQPHHALPHDDHFHVRIACPNSAIGTRAERPPYACVEYPLASAPRKTVLAKSRPIPLPHLPVRKLVRARSTGRIQLEAIPSQPPNTTESRSTGGGTEPIAPEPTSDAVLEHPASIPD